MITPPVRPEAPKITTLIGADMAIALSNLFDINGGFTWNILVISQLVRLKIQDRPHFCIMSESTCVHQRLVELVGNDSILKTLLGLD